MTENNKKKPELRYSEFNHDWEQQKLRELASFSKGNGYSKSDLIDEGSPIILYGRLYTKYETVISKVNTFVKEKEKSVISKGNEVIVPASGETAEDISRASVVNAGGIVLGGDLNIIHPKETINSVFLALTISNGNQQKELSKRAQGKSVVHIHNSDLQEVILPYPSIKEQIKIGVLFQKLDHLITLHQRRYDKTVNLKKAMLEKMFPKDGEDKPEIRFAGFTEAWEPRKLGDVFNDYVEKTTVQNQYSVLTSSQQYGIVLQEEYFANRQVTTDNNIGYYVLPKGYFTYRSRSDNDVFVFNRNDLIDKGIISYFYPVFYVNGVDSNFFLRRLNHGIKRQLIIASEGTGQHVLSLRKFKNINALFPSYDEQEKIGQFFESIDSLITLYQRELVKLKSIKKACLEKMFV